MSNHLRSRWYRVLFTFVFSFIAATVVLSLPVNAHADSTHPGGNVQDPTVLHVDIAQPSVVRIYTSVSGTLKVQLCASALKTYPISGWGLVGSGSFISSHGDILTAAHVVDPPKDDLTIYAIEASATNIAADLQKSCGITMTPDEAYQYFGNLYLAGGNAVSATFDPFQSIAWLSTAYAGADPSNEKVSDVKSYPLSVKAESPWDKNDVAIANAAGLSDTPSIAVGDSNGVSATDSLTVLGFPGNADLGDTINDNLSSNFLTISINQLYVSAIKTDPATGASLIQVGGNIEQGDSGGPALDANGEVVGIVSFGVAPQSLAQVGETRFLQATSSATALLTQANIDQAPGTFETHWSQALSDFASTSSGHWHRSSTELQALASDYPNFKGVSTYLSYAQQQAQVEKSNDNPLGSLDSSSLLGYGLIGLAGLVLAGILVTIIVINRRQNNREKVAVLAAASSYLSSGSTGASAPLPYSPDHYGQQPPDHYGQQPPDHYGQQPPDHYGQQPPDRYGQQPLSSPYAAQTPYPDASRGSEQVYYCVNGHRLQPNQIYCMQCGAPRA